MCAGSYLNVAKPPVAAGYLHLARCRLTTGNLSGAVTDLIESYSAPANPESLFLFAGHVTSADDEYRAWLVEQIVSHERFDDGCRSALADSIVSEKMPELCRRLGVIPRR